MLVFLLVLFVNRIGNVLSRELQMCRYLSKLVTLVSNYSLVSLTLDCAKAFLNEVFLTIC